MSVLKSSNPSQPLDVISYFPKQLAEVNTTQLFMIRSDIHTQRTVVHTPEAALNYQARLVIKELTAPKAVRTPGVTEQVSVKSSKMKSQRPLEPLQILA